jgi:hypothetical protein
MLLIDWESPLRFARMWIALTLNHHPSLENGCHLYALDDLRTSSSQNEFSEDAALFECHEGLRDFPLLFGIMVFQS